MSKAEVKGFGKPDEIREFPKGRLELVTIGGPAFLVAVLQGIQVAAFLIAVLICPPALGFGTVGAVLMAIRNRHRVGAA